MEPEGPGKRPLGGFLAIGIVAAMAAGLLAVLCVLHFQKHGTWPEDLGFAFLCSQVAALLTIPALRSLRRFEPEKGSAFWRMRVFYRLSLYVACGLFVAVIFGRRTGHEIRFAQHMVAGILAFQIGLCFPRALQSLVVWVDRNRVARVVDRLLLGALFSLIAVEGVLQASMRFARSPIPRAGEVTPFSQKLSRTVFGIAPNSMGYNDREFRRERSDSLRVIFVGDSFMVGYVPRPFGVVALAANLLRDRAGGVEVMNFGINGNSPVEYREALSREALDYSPDLVVVGLFLGNDIKQGYAKQSPLHKSWYSIYQVIHHIRQRAKDRAMVKNGEYFDLTKITRLDPEYWFDVSQVPETISREHYLRRLKGHLKICAIDSTAPVERDWQASFDALADMQRLCRENNAVMVLLVCPDPLPCCPDLYSEVLKAGGLTADDYDLLLPHRRVAEFCQQRGLPVIDLLGAFSGLDQPEDYFQPNDNHWSARGNQQAAEALALELGPLLEEIRKEKGSR